MFPGHVLKCFAEQQYVSSKLVKVASFLLIITIVNLLGNKHFKEMGDLLLHTE